MSEDAWFMDTAYLPAYNAKMRKAIQAKQAWVKHQETDTPTPVTTEAHKLSDKRRSTVGGPHDIEFFRCYVAYLDEALIQISAGHPTNDWEGEHQEHHSILSQCS